MKKLILFLAAVFLIGCAAGKKELIQDPIFPENKILFGPQGKEAYVVADPLFEGNYLVFPELK